MSFCLHMGIGVVCGIYNEGAGRRGGASWRVVFWFSYRGGTGGAMDVVSGTLWGVVRMIRRHMERYGTMDEGMTNMRDVKTWGEGAGASLWWLNGGGQGRYIRTFLGVVGSIHTNYITNIP